LPRLRKGKSWKILQLKRPLPEGSEEKNKLLVAPGGFPASWVGNLTVVTVPATVSNSG